MIYVTGFKTLIPKGDKTIVVNTTSRSANWSRGLSPFVLPGGHLYDEYIATNVENAWQYAKVYKDFLNEDGSIKHEYFEWAKKGWSRKIADRYPRGKGEKPEFLYWDHERFGYIEARMKVYYPLYARAVEQSDAFKGLLELCDLCNKEGVDVYLLDFDGYNHISEGYTIEEVFANPIRKAGHAFVIWDLLDKKYDLIKR